MEVDGAGRWSTWTWDCRPNGSTSNPACVGVANSVGRLVGTNFSLDTAAERGTYAVLGYDAVGRLTGEEYALPGIGIQRQTYEYDDLGRTTAKYFPDHTASTVSFQRYVYQGSGGPIRELRYTSGTVAAPVQRSVARFTNYTAAGQLLDRSAAGQRTEYRYDSYGRLDRLSTGNGGAASIPPSSMFQRYGYSYDAIDGVSGITGSRASTLIGGVDTSETQTFTYDPRQRLLSATGVALGGTQRFEYAPSGDITLKDGLTRETGPCGSNAFTCVTAGQPTPVGQLLSWQARHDAVGDRTKLVDFNAGNEWNYTYDAASHLLRAERRRTTTQALEVSATFAYNHAGSRVRKIYTDTSGRTYTTYYLGDYELRTASTNPGSVSSTRHFTTPSGVRVASFTSNVVLTGQATVAGMLGTGAWAGSLIAGLPRGWSFNFPNHIGSGSVVTSEQGVVISRPIFAPYGDPRVANSRGNNVSTIKFAGYDFDEEIDLSYAKARYYDARSARFLTADNVTGVALLRRASVDEFERGT